MERRASRAYFRVRTKRKEAGDAPSAVQEAASQAWKNAKERYLAGLPDEFPPLAPPKLRGKVIGDVD